MRFHISSRRAMLPAVLAAALFTGCTDSITQLKDAVDSFDIIVELPRINTIVAGQVVDAGTRSPINAPVTLSFSGAGAGQLIDVYSDPITSANISNGVLTLGVNNAVTPTAAAPLTFTVTATAPGYRTQTRTVRLTGTNEQAFVLEMIPNSVTAPVQGTSGASNQSGAAGAGGTVTTTVTTTAAPLPNAPGTPSVTIPAGTPLTTASGTPLTGALTTNVRFYGAEGVSNLPEDARIANGEILPVIAAYELQIRDAAGNVAAAAGTSPSIGVFASTMATARAADVTVRITLDPRLFQTYQKMLSDFTGLALGAFYQRARLQGCAVSLEAPNVAVATGQCAAPGIITVGLVLAPTAPPACSPAGTARVTNPNAFSVVVNEVRVTGPANATYNTPITIPAGTTDIPVSQFTNGLRVSQGSYTLRFVVGETTLTVENVNPCTGNTAVTLPSLNRQVYTIVGSVSCPANQKFETQLSEQSLSGIVLSYRPVGSTVAFAAVPKSAVTPSSAPGAITITASGLALTPNTAYEFKGQFNKDEDTKTVTTTATAGQINVGLTASELGMKCKS